MTGQPSGRQAAAMAFGEPVVGGVQHEVVVVTHQPVGQQLGVEAVHRLGKHRQKCMSIPVVNKGQFAPVASRSNVVNRTGKFDSQWAGVKAKCKT